FDREDRRAIRLDPAVAAAFADRFVDEHALRRLGILALLAAPALFRRTGLVVYQYGYAGNFAQLALHGVHVLAIVHRDHRGQLRAILVARQILRDDGDALDAFGCHLLRDQADRNLPVYRLSAGHGDRIVVEDLVGDVDIGRERSANREMSGMEIGTVAEVGEDVRQFREGRLTDPGRTFAAHLARGFGVLRVNRRCHDVASDSRQREAAIRHFGRSVVGTTRAVVGRPWRCADCFFEHGFFRFEEHQPRLDQVTLVEAGDASSDHARDLRDREIGLGRQQPLAARMHPFALVVEFADDPRPYIRMPVVEVFLELILDHLAFLFHYQDFFQPFREFAHAVRFQRPGHRDLEHADADLRCVLFGDAQFLQGFQHIHVGLAGGYDPESGVGRIDGRAIDLVQSRVGHRRVNLVVLQQGFLLARLQAKGFVGQAEIQAPFRHREIGLYQRPDPERIRLDRSRRFDGIG